MPFVRDDDATQQLGPWEDESVQENDFDNTDDEIEFIKDSIREDIKRLKTLKEQQESRKAKKLKRENAVPDLQALLKVVYDLQEKLKEKEKTTTSNSEGQ